MASVKLKLFILLSFTILFRVFDAHAVATVGETKSAPLALDYWEKSVELWVPVMEKRKILVSAKNADQRTHSNGVGLVKAKVDQVWKFATDPEKIKKSSRFLKDFKWNQDTGEVEMTLEMLSIQHLVKGRAEKFPDSENPKVIFKVQEGTLVPFEAELELRSASAQEARNQRRPWQGRGQLYPYFKSGETLVRIQGTSAEGRQLSWPLRVAMEAILQRTASTLREAVEAEKETP